MFHLMLPSDCVFPFRGWAKLRSRLEEANQRKEMFISIAAELMMRQKNSKAKVYVPGFTSS